MCGLAGLLQLTPSTFIDEPTSYLKTSAYLNALRGVDSTGMFYGQDTATIYKKAMPVYDFLQLARTTAILRNANQQKFVAVHTRSATIGETSELNAHPFSSKHITLMHNGTLTNKQELPHAGTDSEGICISMAEKGERETLEKIRGAYALIWFNEKKKTFNIVRNDQRTLFLAHNKEFTKLWYASEKWMVQQALERAKINTKDVTIVSLKPLRWLCIDVNTKSFKHEWNHTTVIKENVAQNSWDMYYNNKKAQKPNNGLAHMVQKLKELSIELTVNNIPKHPVYVTNLEWTPYKTHMPAPNQHTYGKLRGVLHGSDVVLGVPSVSQEVMKSLKKHDVVEVRADYLFSSGSSYELSGALNSLKVVGTSSSVKPYVKAAALPTPQPMVKRPMGWSLGLTKGCLLCGDRSDEATDIDALTEDRIQTKEHDGGWQSDGSYLCAECAQDLMTQNVELSWILEADTAENPKGDLTCAC